LLYLDARRRRAVDGRHQYARIGDADGQGEPGLEGLDGELAVRAVGLNPVVTRRNLKLQHETPFSRTRPVVSPCSLEFRGVVAPGPSVYQRVAPRVIRCPPPTLRCEGRGAYPG